MDGRSSLTEMINGAAGGLKRRSDSGGPPGGGGGGGGNDGHSSSAPPPSSVTHRRKSTVPSRLSVLPVDNCAAAVHPPTGFTLNPVPLQNIIEEASCGQAPPAKRRRGRPPKNPNSTEISSNIKNCVSYMLSQVEMELDGRETPRRRPGRPPKSATTTTTTPIYRNLGADRTLFFDGVRRRPGRPRGRAFGLTRGGRVGRPRLVRTQPYIPTYNYAYFANDRRPASSRFPTASSSSSPPLQPPIQFDPLLNLENPPPTIENIISGAMQHYAILTYMQTMIGNGNPPQQIHHQPIDNYAMIAFMSALAASASNANLSTHQNMNNLISSMMHNDQDSVRQLLESLQQAADDTQEAAAAEGGGGGAEGGGGGRSNCLG